MSAIDIGEEDDEQFWEAVFDNELISEGEHREQAQEEGGDPGQDEGKFGNSSVPRRMCQPHLAQKRYGSRNYPCGRSETGVSITKEVRPETQDTGGKKPRKPGGAKGQLFEEEMMAILSEEEFFFTNTPLC